MRFMICAVLVLFAVPKHILAQGVVLDSVVCDPYNPEDTVGEVVWNLLNDYDRFGHFGYATERKAKKEYVEAFKNLFVPLTMVPNDLEGVEQIIQTKNIHEFINVGARKGYVPYTLIAEKTEFKGAKGEDDTVFTGYVRLFKLFSDTARIGKEYELGVYYELEIQLNTSSLRAWISNITLIDQQLYTNFLLNAFGYQGNSQIMLSYNLNKLIGYKEPPKPKVAVLTKSNYHVHAGYVATDYMGAESFAFNENPNATFGSSQYGFVGGLHYQKAYGTNGFFGILFGFEVEQNTYSLTHRNITMSYTRDCDGNLLTDLEGGEYDQKRGEIALVEESGQMTLLRPEVGLFINVPFTTKFNIQFYGALGNAFKLNSTYSANATVSYSGTKDDYIVEDEPALGFYTNKVVLYSGTHNNVQNFMFYRMGASFDMNVMPWLAFSLQVEYRSSLTYAMRFRNYPCLYQDPDDLRSFVSQFDALKTSRSYNAVGFQAGFKIFLKEKRQQQ